MPGLTRVPVYQHAAKCEVKWRHFRCASSFIWCSSTTAVLSLLLHTSTIQLRHHSMRYSLSACPRIRLAVSRRGSTQSDACASHAGCMLQTNPTPTITLTITLAHSRPSHRGRTPLFHHYTVQYPQEIHVQKGAGDAQMGGQTFH